MELEELRAYCLSRREATEGFPFNEDVLVFKVRGKMFALISLSEPDTVNLKADPEQAMEWRESWEEVQPGWHMNKTNWNTVSLRGRLGRELIREMIDHSWTQVVKGMKKADQRALLDE